MSLPHLERVALSSGQESLHKTDGYDSSGALHRYCPRAKLTELSGDNRCARTTMAVSALLDTQRNGEPSAWVQFRGAALYPPDLSHNGVDLSSLAVVMIEEKKGHFGLLKAAEILMRSRAFGLVIIDLGQSKLRTTKVAWQGRLLALAREHHTAVILITDKSTGTGSLGPLVALRIEPRRARIGPGVFSVEPVLLKNKLGMPEALPMKLGAPWGLK